MSENNGQCGDVVTLEMGWNGEIRDRNRQIGSDGEMGASNLEW